MEKSNNKDDVFWLQDPSILLKTYLYFIPTKNMTSNQKFNAITLFCLYFLVLLILFRMASHWLYLPIIILIVVIGLYYAKSTPMQKEENFEPIIETGYIDSNNNLNFNRVTGRVTQKPEVVYQCRAPTPDNPFMNPPISDYNTPAPSACNADDENIQNSVTKAFTKDLYMDIDDAFDKMNSQRQFYTVPNTSIPNNQTEFANWLYRSPVTCKEDQEQCLRYEDLRFKR